jgi:hypothetical protein
MDHDPTSSVTDPAEHNPEKTRKPYTKPAFQSERVFETMALACGKIGTTSATCALNTKNS